MTTATIEKRNLWQAVVLEPVELAISQPHQALISTASVYLVAAEAGMLIAQPWNVALAIGAEWAYLKGLSSGQRVTTPWAARLNWSAVALVIAYGTLFGLRKFGVLPPAGAEPQPVTDAWGVAGALVLTLIHILCIGAVTLCSAMVHRESMTAEGRKADERAAREAERAAELQKQRDAIALETERERQQIALEAERTRERLALWQQKQEIAAQLKKSASLAVRTARTASPEGASASVLACPHCGAELPDAGAKGRAVRYGYCPTCKPKEGAE